MTKTVATRRYGLIGAGMMGAEHVNNLALIDGAELVAVADPFAPSLDRVSAQARNFFSDVDQYRNYQSLLGREDIDAVIIAAPNHAHYDLANAAMDAGKSILLEKPMCTTHRDAKNLYERSLSYAPLLWIGLEYRYMPPVTRFIDHVRSGIAGPIKMLSIREHRFPFLQKIGDWNRFNKNTGGTLVEKCCHFFDLMRFILDDEPTRVFASGGQDVNHLDERYGGVQPDILDNAYVIVDFRRGARAMLDLCMFAEGAPEQEDIIAVGPVGRLEAGVPSSEVRWRPRARQDGFVEQVDVPPDILAAGDHHGATYYQLMRFHEALIARDKPEISALDGLRSVQMGLAAQESIDTGAPVSIDAGLSPMSTIKEAASDAR
ncbi:MAG: Gfo/Idh/MocA family oxidoreductase [Pseudomonadota bacterium]